METGSGEGFGDAEPTLSAPPTTEGALLVFSGPVNRNTGHIQCEDGEIWFINPLLLGGEEKAVLLHMGYQNAMLMGLFNCGCSE